MKIDVNGREFGLILDALVSYKSELYKVCQKKDIEKWRKKNFENDVKDIEKILNDFGSAAIREMEKNWYR